jgi:S-adenosylmethionine:tRNA ribosyltransferase-isomerase
MLQPDDLPPIKNVRTITRLTSVDPTPPFHLPSALNADRPPERRGLARDRVRLLVLDRKTGNVTHTRFDRIVEYFKSGDLLVFNCSRTLPATLVGRFKDSPSKIETRLAQALPDGTWLGLLLPEVGTEAENLLGKVSILDFGGGLHCQVVEQDKRIPRLWKLRFSKSGTEFLDLVYRNGQPIRYRYLSAPWRLGHFQNVYARQPGAAEMPSAGRAFSWRLLLQLRNRGVETAFIALPG